MPMIDRLARRLTRAASLRIAESIPREDARVLLRSLRPLDPGLPFVRVGPDSDGGYLLPDDLDGITHCFSPGVGSTSDFERELVEKGITCFLADYSVNRPVLDGDGIFFDKKYVGCSTDDVFVTLDDWVSGRLVGETGDFLLQMDIEGGEYAALLNVSDRLLQLFRIIVVEFHSVDKWFDSRFHQFVVEPMFRKLLRYFRVVHLHPNNYCPAEEVAGILVPPLMEVTFLRKDRLINDSPRHDFPHELDRDNVAKPTVVLPECWFR